jgi:hypothetical protein
MKPIRDLAPYMHSKNECTNTSLSLMKLYKRARRITATYKPDSLYRQRMKNQRAMRRAALHVVR